MLLYLQRLNAVEVIAGPRGRRGPPGLLKLEEFSEALQLLRGYYLHHDEWAFYVGSTNINMSLSLFVYVILFKDG